MQNVFGGLVLIAVVLLFLLDLFILLLDELERDFLRHCFAGVVGRLNFDPGRIALEVDITFRISIRHGFAAGADERSRALHFSARSVGDLGLHAIRIIPFVFLFRLWHFELDDRFAARIKRGVAFRNHISAGVARIVFVAALILWSGRVVELVARIVAPPPVVITLFLDVVMHLGVRDRRAKEVVG